MTGEDEDLININLDNDAYNDIEEDIDMMKDEEDINLAPTSFHVPTEGEVAASQTQTSRIADQTQTETTQKGRKRARTSKVWSQFTELPVGPNGKAQCKCNICGAVFACPSKSGTGHLLRHMNNCKKKDTRDVGQMMLSATNSYGSMGVSDGIFSEEQFRNLIAGAISMHNLPFGFVEYRGVRTCFEYLRPGVRHISRNTAKADVLKLYEHEKSKVKNVLSVCSGRVSLTSDLWTAINGDGYMVVTAHLIDDDWLLRKYILSLKYMSSPHTGLALSEKLFQTLVAWGIVHKVFTLTLDNTSANDVMVNFMKVKLNPRKSLLLNGDIFHVRCCAHILNLIVQDGLKDAGDIVVNVRESVKYVRGSQARKQKFMDCVRTLCLDGKQGLRQDVPTRWNSTYLMLKSALYYKDAFKHLKVIDSGYTFCPTSEEWEKVKVLCTFLGTYYELTCLFSGTKYPTSNLFFPAIHKVYRTLLTLKESFDYGDVHVLLRTMPKKMLEKFEKYWFGLNETFAIAVILDPRFKFEFIEWAYKKIYGDGYESHSKKVRKLLSTLFEIYQQQSQSYVSSSTGSSTSHINTNESLFSHPPPPTTVEPVIDDMEFYKDYDEYVNAVSEVHKSELESYLEDKNIPRTEKLDILQFWRKNQLRYPLLSSMARDILCIPITTVASESAFSSAGIIIDRFRSSIDSDNAEALLCMRDWLHGEQDIAEAIQEFQKYTDDILV